MAASPRASSTASTPSSTTVTWTTAVPTSTGHLADVYGGGPVLRRLREIEVKPK